MDFKDFDEMIDAVEIDPRARVKLGARHVIERELADVPEDVVALILPSRLGWLARRAREIEREHFAQIDGLLNAFASDLTNGALWEKKKGELIAVARRIAERELADVPDHLRPKFYRRGSTGSHSEHRRPSSAGAPSRSTSY